MNPLPVEAVAPTYALRDQHGQDVTSASLLGSPTLLVFYPFAFSPVCGSELEALRDQLDRFAPATVVAVSVDSHFTLRAYADSAGLTFPLLSDFWPHGAVAEAFGVLDAASGTAERSTFLVDVDGVIRWSVHNPRHEARDTDAYVAAISSL